MSRLGAILRTSRKSKRLTLYKASVASNIDAAIISKVERGIRRPTKLQLKQLANLYELDRSGLIELWLSEKIMDQVKNEDQALDAISLAEQNLLYEKTKETPAVQIESLLNEAFKSDERILAAWVFGSYARSESKDMSDIDIMISVDETSDFSLFDLADLQYKCEQTTDKNIDLVVEGSLDPAIKEKVEQDLIIIYEKL